MHILENHVIPWLRRWHIGAGFRGEQGAESIHSHVKKLEGNYSGIANEVDKLKYIIIMHGTLLCWRLHRVYNLGDHPERGGKLISLLA